MRLQNKTKQIRIVKVLQQQIPSLTQQQTQHWRKIHAWGFRVKARKCLIGTVYVLSLVIKHNINC